jgi:cytochrome d ubiquinol oxidase subunit I
MRAALGNGATRTYITSMDSLDAARAQMEISLGFHMIFAALGIGMPLLMVIAEGLYVRRGDPHHLVMAKKWAKATSVLFVVGAVSGTALSFELGLLWPGFVAFAGPIVGPAFTLEGYAFLTEAIFIGIYLYGWDRLTAKQHWWTGVAVAVSACASGILVVGANAWMQSPRGYTLRAGELVDLDPLAVFANPSWVPLALHSTLACYASVGFAVAGVYAYALVRGRGGDYERAALRIAMTMGVAAALLQPLSGDRLAKLLHQTQPAKLAAMEAHFETRASAPLLVGGIPDEGGRTVRYGFAIPGVLSFLATGDSEAVIVGLDDIPEDERPNPVVCHVAFQIMVLSGFAMAAVGAAYALQAWLSRKAAAARDPRGLLWAIVLASPLGFLALEAGWVVTEAGRQPWIVYGVMRTADAVTPRTDVFGSLVAFGSLYVMLGAALVLVLRRISTMSVHVHSAVKAHDSSDPS